MPCLNFIMNPEAVALFSEKLVPGCEKEVPKRNREMAGINIHLTRIGRFMKNDLIWTDD